MDHQCVKAARVLPSDRPIVPFSEKTFTDNFSRNIVNDDIRFKFCPPYPGSGYGDAWGQGKLCPRLLAERCLQRKAPPVLDMSGILQQLRMTWVLHFSFQTFDDLQSLSKNLLLLKLLMTIK